MPKFSVNQRVSLPGYTYAQALIVDVQESVPGFPIYEVYWFDAETRAAKGFVGEGDLVAANAEPVAAAATEPVTLAATAKRLKPKRRKASPKRKR